LNNFAGFAYEEIALEYPKASSELYLKVSPELYLKVSPELYLKVSPELYLKVSPELYLKASPEFQIIFLGAGGIKKKKSMCLDWIAARTRLFLARSSGKTSLKRKRGRFCAGLWKSPWV